MPELCISLTIEESRALSELSDIEARTIEAQAQLIIRNELQRLELIHRRDNKRKKIRSLLSDIDFAERELKQSRDAMKKAQESVASFQRDVNQINAQLQNLRDIINRRSAADVLLEAKRIYGFIEENDNSAST